MNDDSLVTVQIENPYYKLTQTPLAQTTTVLGVSATKCFIALCALYVILDLVPGFYITGMPLDPQTSNFIDVEKAQNQMQAAIVIIYVFGSISLIALVILIIGITRRNTIMVYKSLIGLELNTLLARLFPLCIYYVMPDYNLLREMGILFLVDLVILGLMIVILGKFAGECRNIKYSKRVPQTCYLSTQMIYPPQAQGMNSYANYPNQYGSSV